MCASPLPFSPDWPALCFKKGGDLSASVLANETVYCFAHPSSRHVSLSQLHFRSPGAWKVAMKHRSKPDMAGWIPTLLQGLHGCTAALWAVVGYARVSSKSCSSVMFTYQQRGSCASVIVLFQARVCLMKPKVITNSWVWSGNEVGTVKSKINFYSHKPISVC